MVNPVLKPKGNNYLVSEYQTAGQIAGAIVKAINDSKPSAQYLSKFFKTNNPVKSLRLLFWFTKKAVPYKKESGNSQTAKTLPRILSDANKVKINGVIGGDCKHYSILVGSIGKALGIPMKLRLIAQGYTPVPNHIYCIAKINGKQYIIDPVLKEFNKEAKYNYKYDIKI